MLIKSGYDGMYVLVMDQEGPEIQVHDGQEFRVYDDIVQVYGGTPPHKPGSTGRVLCRYKTSKHMDREWFPGVIECRWRKLRPSEVPQ
jgi:hypothetical protein